MLEYNRSIAVILPAYNEELTIAGTLRAFHAVMPDAFFYVVDNNSTDATAHIAEETLANLGAQGGLLHEARQGKGNAVRRAFFEIDADVYVLVDADMTYPAEALPQLVAPILAGEADMVYGDRLSEGDYARQNRRTFHGFGNSLVQGLVNAVSGTHFTDIMTGYRALSRAFVKSYPVLVEGFQLETYISLFAAQARLRVLGIPIRYVDRPEGSYSKLNTFKDGFRVLSTIFTIFRQCNPLVFFSFVAACCVVLSVLCGAVVIGEWLTTHFVTRVPLAVLSVAFGLLGAIALGTGFTLDAINYHRRLQLEAHLQQSTTPRFSLRRSSSSPVIERS